MKLTYVGPFDEVEVLTPGGQQNLGVVERDGVIEVPDEVGKELLKQEGVWERAKGDTKKKEG